MRLSERTLAGRVAGHSNIILLSPLLYNLRMDWTQWVGNIVSALLSAAIGAGVVYYFGIRQLVTQRRSDFRKQQLAEFYAPLAGMHQQIRAKTALRVKVSGAANTAWHEICEQYRGVIMDDHEDRYAPFKRIIEYENKQLEAELLPQYRSMLQLFTDRYHLADLDTRAFYQDFLEFVEIWNRWLAGALPAEVLEKLEHTEERVQPFYKHIESKMNLLQTELLGTPLAVRAGGLVAKRGAIETPQT